MTTPALNKIEQEARAQAWQDYRMWRRSGYSPIEALNAQTAVLADVLAQYVLSGMGEPYTTGVAYGIRALFDARSTARMLTWKLGNRRTFGDAR